MPRLKSTATGSIVNVSDETAARLGSAYQPVAEKQESKKAASKKSSSKSE